MPRTTTRGDKAWEYVKEIVAFGIGAYLLVHTQKPNTVTGFCALALMGVLPAKVILDFLFGDRRK
jgi:hypothetical protein